MNNCLITGCEGFIGSYLAEFLLAEGLDVYGIVYGDSKNIDHLRDRLTIVKCDILDKGGVESIITKVKPSFVFHLAAQSLPERSWQDPEITLKINVLGTLYLLDGIRKAAIDPMIEVFGSSAEYGFSHEDEIPIKETKELCPSNPYGISKMTADMLAYLYWRTYGLRIIRVRPFYIIGPRKTNYAPSEFARSIVHIECGREKILKVGNLDAVREVVDIQDTVRALWLLAEKGLPGEVYNLCSGKGHKIGELLDEFISLSSARVKIERDAQKMHPADEPVLVGDSSKLRQLGWRPQIRLQDSLANILNFWRKQPSDD